MVACVFFNDSFMKISTVTLKKKKKLSVSLLHEEIKK